MNDNCLRISESHFSPQTKEKKTNTSSLTQFFLFFLFFCVSLLLTYPPYLKLNMGNKLSYQSRKKRISNSTTAKKSSIHGNSSSLIDEKHHDTDSNTHTSSVCTSGRKSSHVSTTTYWFPNHNDELDRLSSVSLQICLKINRN